MWVCWGTTDGGTTNGGSWQNTNETLTGGYVGGYYRTSISGLAAQTEYYYGVYAYWTDGGAWASNSDNSAYTVGSRPFQTGPQVLPFEESYEARYSGDIQGQHGWAVDAHSAAIVQTAVTHGGTKACSLTNNAGSARVQMSHGFSDATATNIVWVDFYSRPLFSADAVVPTNVAAVFFVQTNTGYVVAYNFTNQVTNTTLRLESNAWTRFAAKCDYGQKKWDLWVNNTQVVASFSFYDPNRTALTAFNVDEGSAGGLSYIDDLRVSALSTLMVPTISNKAPTGVQSTEATLKGSLITNGAAPAYVYLFWGTNDAGTNILSWKSTNSADVGPWSVPVEFQYSASSLLPSTKYYYRYFASNVYGLAWAPTTTNFTTPGAMQITNMVRAGSDVLLACRGVNGATYSVLTSDDNAQSWGVLLSAVCGESGAVVFTNVNFATLGGNRLFKLVENNGGTIQTNPTVWGAFAQTRQSNSWYLLSSPVNLGPIGNNLSNTLGRQLADGLSANANQAAADKLYIWNGSWTTYSLLKTGGGANTNWYDDSFALANRVITTGDVFWVRRAGGVQQSSKSVFFGEVYPAARTMTLANGWSTFGWSYGTQKRQDASGSPVDAFGFVAAGATGGSKAGVGDEIWLFVNGGWRQLWLIAGVGGGADGKWWDENSHSYADFTLTPGVGYWYRNRGSAFSWTPTSTAP